MGNDNKLKLLITESDPILLKLIETIMKGRGYGVVAAREPSNCPLYGKLDCECPKGLPCYDAILTDMIMPKMSGVEFLEAQSHRGCKLNPENKALIATMLTQHQKKQIQELGCHIFEKPIKVEAIMDWLEGTRERARKHLFRLPT